MVDKKGNKTGGRKKGSVNIRTDELYERLHKMMPGYCPVTEMALIAQDDENDKQLRFAAHKEVAPYLYAKLKQVDGSIDVNGNLIVEIKKYGAETPSTE